MNMSWSKCAGKPDSAVPTSRGTTLILLDIDCFVRTLLLLPILLYSHKDGIKGDASIYLQLARTNLDIGYILQHITSSSLVGPHYPIHLEHISPHEDDHVPPPQMYTN